MSAGARPSSAARRTRRTSSSDTFFSLSAKKRHSERSACVCAPASRNCMPTAESPAQRTDSSHRQRSPASNVAPSSNSARTRSSSASTAYMSVAAMISSREEKYSYSVPLPMPAASAICCTVTRRRSPPSRARRITPSKIFSFFPALMPRPPLRRRSSRACGGTECRTEPARRSASKASRTTGRRS